MDLSHQKLLKKNFLVNLYVYIFIHVSFLEWRVCDPEAPSLTLCQITRFLCGYNPLESQPITSIGETKEIDKPFRKWQILDSSKLREFADDNFKFNENDREFAIRVENTVGKGEIARYEQFLLFSHCFQKSYTADM